MSRLASVTQHELLHKGHPRSTPLEPSRSQVYQPALAPVNLHPLGPVKLNKNKYGLKKRQIRGCSHLLTANAKSDVMGLKHFNGTEISTVSLLVSVNEPLIKWTSKYSITTKHRRIEMEDGDQGKIPSGNASQEDVNQQVCSLRSGGAGWMLMATHKILTCR